MLYPIVWPELCNVTNEHVRDVSFKVSGLGFITYPAVI